VLQRVTGSKIDNEDQWNRIEDPDTDPCSHLIFEKGTQNMCWREDNGAVKTGYPSAEE
jgi:hypothetical protein